MRIPLITSCVLFLLPLAATGADMHLSMMYSNGTTDVQPFVLFQGKEWRAQDDARYIKLHMYFDEHVQLSGFELVPCKESKTFQPLSFFVNFDEVVLEPEKRGESAKQTENRSDFIESTKALFEVLSARSLTINFERNRAVRLCGLKLFDGAGKPYNVRVPAIVPGTATASSTLKPAEAYDAMNLFDSRFEYAWASDKVRREVTLEFRLSEARTVTRLMIWNGYQRSPTHCQQNSRARVIRLESESGQVERVQLKDEFGAQVLRLSRPMRGARLRLTVEESYAGLVYQDLAISELRFGDNAEWFALDATQHLRQIAERNRRSFDRSGLRFLLGESFADPNIGMIVRLRADSSFFLSGAYEQKEEEHSFFTLGNFEVLPSSEPGTLKLRLFGVYSEAQVYGDCNACGWDCNSKDVEGRFRGRIFQQNVMLRKSGSDGVQMTPEGQRRLRFTKAVLKKQAE